MNCIKLSRFRVLSCVFLLAAGLVASTSRAANNYSEDWTAGNENGWQRSTTSTNLMRDDTFGNPAGSLVLRRILDPPVFDLGATTELPAASGDYTGVPMWMVSFDVYYQIGAFSDTWLRFRYQDSSFDGWHLDVADAFPASWESYSVMFDPSWTNGEAAANGWVDETAGAISWQTLMSDVYHPEVRLVLSDEQSALGYIDNFVLKSIPEPASLGLLMVAMLALTSQRLRRDMTV